MPYHAHRTCWGQTTDECRACSQASRKPQTVEQIEAGGCTVDSKCEHSKHILVCSGYRHMQQLWPPIVRLVTHSMQRIGLLSTECLYRAHDRNICSCDRPPCGWQCRHAAYSWITHSFKQLCFASLPMLQTQLLHTASCCEHPPCGWQLGMRTQGTPS